MYLKKRTANIRRLPNESLMLAINGAPADNDTLDAGGIYDLRICHKCYLKVRENFS